MRRAPKTKGIMLNKYNANESPPGDDNSGAAAIAMSITVAGTGATKF